MNKQKIQKEIFQIFPKENTGDEWKTQKHKWCVVITNKKIAERLKLYLAEFSKKRIITIDGNKAFENFKAPEGSLMNKISACQIDNSTLRMNSIKYDKEFEVFFLFTGMSLDEVNKSYKDFLDKLRKIFKKQDEKKEVNK